MCVYDMMSKPVHHVQPGVFIWDGFWHISGGPIDRFLGRNPLIGVHLSWPRCSLDRCAARSIVAVARIGSIQSGHR